MKKVTFLKICLFEHETLTLVLWQSVRKCPSFLEIREITNYDMGFQKNDIPLRYSIVNIFWDIQDKPKIKMENILVTTTLFGRDWCIKK